MAHLEVRRSGLHRHVERLCLVPGARLAKPVNTKAISIQLLLLKLDKNLHDELAREEALFVGEAKALVHDIEFEPVICGDRDIDRAGAFEIAG